MPKRRLYGTTPTSPIVYVHYCVDPDGITYILLSADKYAASGGFMDSGKMNAAVTMIKTVPSGKRKYDPTNKIWYVDNEYWNPIYKFFGAGPEAYELVSHLDDEWDAFLAGSNKSVDHSWTNVPENVAAKNFFHNFNSAIEKLADNKSDKQVLASLLGLTTFDEIPSDKAAAKKLYRTAALRLHPDKNGGDGSKMATLNELWGEYVNI